MAENKTTDVAKVSEVATSSAEKTEIPTGSVGKKDDPTVSTEQVEKMGLLSTIEMERKRLPLSLMETLIKAEIRQLDSALTYGYEGYVICAELIINGNSFSNERAYHLYQWMGDAILYKRGLLSDTWTKKYDVKYTGDYVVLTGTDSSPLIRATFKDQILWSMVEPDPMTQELMAQPALLYCEEGKKTHHIYDRYDEFPPWPHTITTPKEYYYWRGYSAEADSIVTTMKREREAAETKARNDAHSNAVLKTLTTVMGKRVFKYFRRHNRVTHTYYTGQRINCGYDSDGPEYEEESIELDLFGVSIEECDFGQKTTLRSCYRGGQFDKSNVKKWAAERITLLNNKLHSIGGEPAVVWMNGSKAWYEEGVLIRKETVKPPKKSKR